MHRRELILAGLYWPLLAPVGALAGTRATTAAPLEATAGAFDDSTVPALARALASAPYRAPETSLTPALAGLGYDQYRDLRFDPARALWRDAGLPFQAQLFHRGFLFKQRVEVYEVQSQRARRVRYSPDMFDFGAATAPAPGDLGFAGVRLHAALNRPDYFDEVCAFLGASYFRALGRGHVYGLSARGLALGTASAEGEEFPFFRTFWLERPAPGAASAVVHALLDSPSVAGAYRFTVTPGHDTVVEVSMRLYPRVDLTAAGIAPLTSMFEFGANDRVGVDDFRPAVHDSDGLALLTGGGEQAWRPLHNPATLQESTFIDQDPGGFGLMQRQRSFGGFEDSEARYHLRPSAWVEPLGRWGKGAVHLIEIPTADEYHDNIVAFWRPSEALAAGREHRFDYRIRWCDRRRSDVALATVANTMIGAAEVAERRRVVIDIDGGAPARMAADSGLAAEVAANPGRVHNVVAHRVEETGQWRITFELEPGGSETVELRARLLHGGDPVSETWLYRWTA